MIFVESLIFEKSFFACFAFPFLPPFTVGPLWCFVILFLLCQPFRCLSVCRGCSSTPLIGFLLSSLLNYSLSNNIHTSTDGNHRQLEWQRMTEAVCVCVYADGLNSACISAVHAPEFHRGGQAARRRREELILHSPRRQT